MTRRLWPYPHSEVEPHYGLGTMERRPAAGAGSAIPAASKATSPAPARSQRRELTVSVLTNAVDGWASSGSKE